MKNKLLFFDMKFTSLSPDSQLISLGIISDCDKTIYCEFSDFDINRCDDWVKENVVSKLKFYKITAPDIPSEDNMDFVLGDMQYVSKILKQWLSQFSDYQIQFITDCGTFDWYWMLQLLAEWETKKELIFTEVEHQMKPEHLRHKAELEMFHNAKGREIVRVIDKMPKMNIDIKPHIITGTMQDNSAYYVVTKTGLPKLPANISPVPFDLNDLISIKKGITPMEAFDLNREEIAYGFCVKFMSEVEYLAYKGNEPYSSTAVESKHTALWDAQVIKEIYNKLK